ncbi:dihydrofolate reductase family protein [Actinomycetospora lemnae]|uniref:Dihydrofolate reductase family protein n=1 Tax=Actinomycetospora lemnae TaxID=3019891 RepID=A0ABT5SQS7_9PSEU|nr:dihydrofolate reductase family protein [Actinomycetospora sp. DW7H6]MDD7964820.1 dihydrofolate reductase family protein [Actinomycetospora sp. DW7H6]
MARLRVHAFTITLDGFGAGVDQRLDAPFGDGVEGLHDWMEPSFSRRRRGAELDHGDSRGTGVDDAAFRAGEENVGATIMGRNMFGPVRGAWPDESWRGWWGEDPPYHHDVFVLTHHARPSLPMDGGTTFHFLEATPEEVLARATEAAGGKDVRLGGGVATVRAFLAEGLVDELDLVVAPILAGAGERLFEGLRDLPAGYRVDALTPGESGVVHARVVRR